MTRPKIILAGATGDLGGRIARALVARGACVHALVRAGASVAENTRLDAMGLAVAEADAADVSSLVAACSGAVCVISALNGLRDVIVERQSVLLDGAVIAGVPRFIPSDYSADFTRTRPGDNRNLDLRREFMAHADRAPIAITSILNGAFMDMLGAEMPIIQPRIRRVLCWGDADQPLNFTTKDDVASYTASAALDDASPRILRISGDTLSARDLADVMAELTGKPFRTLRAGGIGSLDVLIRLAKFMALQPSEVFPAWQGMQYMRDMFSGRGKIEPRDNDHYPGMRWTSVRTMMKRRASLEKLENHGA